MSFAAGSGCVGHRLTELQGHGLLTFVELVGFGVYGMWVKGLLGVRGFGLVVCLGFGAYRKGLEFRLYRVRKNSTYCLQRL